MLIVVHLSTLRQTSIARWRRHIFVRSCEWMAETMKKRDVTTWNEYTHIDNYVFTCYTISGIVNICCGFCLLLQTVWWTRWRWEKTHQKQKTQTFQSRIRSSPWNDDSKHLRIPANANGQQANGKSGTNTSNNGHHPSGIQVDRFFGHVILLHRLCEWL